MKNHTDLPVAFHPTGLAGALILLILLRRIVSLQMSMRLKTIVRSPDHLRKSTYSHPSHFLLFSGQYLLNVRR